jgi:hypothetical protein
MTIGSAASLVGTLPKAPLFPLPMTRKGITSMPHSWGDAAPPRTVPLQKAAGDPPRGHILAASADVRTALEVQRLLLNSEYRIVGPAGSAQEVNRLIDRVRRPLICGLLDLDLPDATGIADRLLVREVPIVWLASNANAALPIAHAAAPVVHRPFSRDDLIEAVEASIRHRASPSVYVTPPPQAAWPRIFPQL